MIYLGKCIANIIESTYYNKIYLEFRLFSIQHNTQWFRFNFKIGFVYIMIKDKLIWISVDKKKKIKFKCQMSYANILLKSLPPTTIL